jgi:hypothetical protein
MSFSWASLDFFVSLEGGDLSPPFCILTTMTCCIIAEQISVLLLKEKKAIATAEIVA